MAAADRGPVVGQGLKGREPVPEPRPSRVQQANTAKPYPNTSEQKAREEATSSPKLQANSISPSVGKGAPSRLKIKGPWAGERAAEIKGPGGRQTRFHLQAASQLS